MGDGKLDEIERTSPSFYFNFLRYVFRKSFAFCVGVSKSG